MLRCRNIPNLAVLSKTSPPPSLTISLTQYLQMEPEADSDKEEEPAHLLTAWLGELDTLKKVNNC